MLRETPLEQLLFALKSKHGTTPCGLFNEMNIAEADSFLMKLDERWGLINISRYLSSFIENEMSLVGWSDLTLVKDGKVKSAEVKSKNDRLSYNQLIKLPLIRKAMKNEVDEVFIAHVY